jgi:hypothetical protein
MTSRFKGLKPGTRKPGEFKARCRRGEWVPISDIPAEKQIEGMLKASRWDRRVKAEVTPVQCDFETEDRAAFEAHMAEVHGGGIYRYDAGGLTPTTRTTKNYSPRMPIPGEDVEGTPAGKRGRALPGQDGPHKNVPDVRARARG